VHGYTNAGQMVNENLKNLDRSFFRFVTMHTFDRQTDRQNSHRYTASAFHAFLLQSHTGIIGINAVGPGQAMGINTCTGTGDSYTSETPNGFCP